MELREDVTKVSSISSYIDITHTVYESETCTDINNGKEHIGIHGTSAVIIHMRHSGILLYNTHWLEVNSSKLY